MATKLTAASGKTNQTAATSPRLPQEGADVDVASKVAAAAKACRDLKSQPEEHTLDPRIIFKIEDVVPNSAESATGSVAQKTLFAKLDNGKTLEVTIPAKLLPKVLSGESTITIGAPTPADNATVMRQFLNDQPLWFKHLAPLVTDNPRTFFKAKFIALQQKLSSEGIPASPELFTQFLKDLSQELGTKTFLLFSDTTKTVRKAIQQLPKTFAPNSKQHKTTCATVYKVLLEADTIFQQIASSVAQPTTSEQAHFKDTNMLLLTLNAHAILNEVKPYFELERKGNKKKKKEIKLLFAKPLVNFFKRGGNFVTFQNFLLKKVSQFFVKEEESGEFTVRATPFNLTSEAVANILKP
ncbi:hypothetical protein COB21_02970 [Candidatus Aerophobetes bacterium]|uniref:Uncharacterized protein n=1 Tax=Aerophobetes bacterium TaxID=2030807 RepID=A0A2A4X4J2_UNCAE|nr:MAG: hypothetical protein COB21_02970 [Candidatus Aerophobetes bacterium]